MATSKKNGQFLDFFLIGEDKQSIHLSHLCNVNWSTASYFASHDREYFCKNSCYTDRYMLGLLCVLQEEYLK